MALDTAIALISLADAKTQLEISGSGDDTILNDLINGVSSMCNTYCGRHLLQKTHTEYYNGNGFDEIILLNFPIISVTSLYNADNDRNFNSSTQVDVSANVLVKSKSGILQLWNNEGIFTKGTANIKVVYSAGYALSSVPYDIQLAVRKWVAQQYKKYQSKRYEVQSETVGENTKTYIDREIPLEVQSVLDHYVIPFGAPDFSYAD